MSSYFSQYDIATGRVRFTNACPDDQLPPEGPLYEGSELAVIHGKYDPNTDVIRSGLPFEIAEDALTKQQNEALWFKFRALRVQKMLPFDFLFFSDYPVPTDPTKLAFYNAEKQRRKLTREIREHTDNPKEAMEMLNEIWSKPDDVE